MKFLILVLSLCSFLTTPAHAAPVDKIVAVVNEEIITQSQLNEQVRLTQQQAAQAQQPAPSTQKILDQLINMRLQMQYAKTMGITASDEAVEQTIEGIAQRNNFTVPQLMDALKKEGINPTRYRKDIRDQMILGQLHQRIVGNRIKVTDDEITRHMRSEPEQQNQQPAEYHVVDILLPTRKDAEETLAHLRAGGKFNELPIIKAKGIEALEGGDLGWRKLSELPTQFVPYVQKLRPGQLSDIIQASNGFHVLHLVDMRGEAPAQNQRSVTETEVRHILLRNTMLTKPSDLKLRLINLRRDLEHGGDFAKLAMQYSQDTQSAPKGGDLGWIRAGTMDPQFEQAMASLKPGQISQPFATSAGWHLVQVIKRRQVDNSKNFMKERARQEAYGEKADAAVRLWVQQIRAEAYVQIVK